MPAGAVVEAADERQFLRQRADAQGQPFPEARRVGRLAAGGVDAVVDGQLRQLGVVEVDHVPVAVRALAAREHAGHVGDLLEHQVVEHDRHVVARQHDVLLEVVGAERVGVGLGRERVFRQVAGGAAMGDHDRRAGAAGNGR